MPLFDLPQSRRACRAPAGWGGSGKKWTHGKVLVTRGQVFRASWWHNSPAPSWGHRAVVCAMVAPGWRSPGPCRLLPLRSHHLPGLLRMDLHMGVIPPKPAPRACRGPPGAPPALPHEHSELTEVLGWRRAPPTPLPRASLPASPAARTGERQREKNAAGRAPWTRRPGERTRKKGSLTAAPGLFTHGRFLQRG